MSKKDKYLFIFGVVLCLIANAFFGCLIYIMFVLDGMYDIDGIIISSLFYLIPLGLGITLIIKAKEEEGWRLKTGYIAMLMVSLFYLNLLFNIMYFHGGRNIELASLDQLIDRSRLNANLIPFKTIKYYISALIDGSINRNIPIMNLGANIIMFIPAGFLLPIISSKTRNRKSAYIVLLLIVTVMEMTQYIFSLGALDIDDIILNFGGAVIGWEIVGLKHVQKVLKKTYLFS